MHYEQLPQIYKQLKPRGLEILGASAAPACNAAVRCTTTGSSDARCLLCAGACAAAAFPCNQFNSQEPKSHAKILEFTSKRGVTFPIFAKVGAPAARAAPRVGTVADSPRVVVLHVVVGAR